MFVRTQRLIEAGMTELLNRGGIVTSLMLRLTNPQLLYDFLAFERQQQLTLEDTKGIFLVLIFGTGLVLSLNALFLFSILLNIVALYLRIVILKICFFVRAYLVYFIVKIQVFLNEFILSRKELKNRESGVMPHP